MESKELVPVWEKYNLTVKEAAAYSNLGEKKIESLLKEPGCEFLLMKGSHRLVKRKFFEEYMDRLSAI